MHYRACVFQEILEKERKVLKVSAEDNRLSDARRQREWLDAMEAQAEAEVNAQRANEALAEANEVAERKKNAFFESLGSSSTPE